MLYDSVSIIAYGFCIAFSPPLIGATTTTILASSEQHLCPGTSNDQCIIHCDVKEEKEVTRHFNCGSVENCQFECDELKCIGIGGSINATNAQNLHVSSNADDCLFGATVYTPSDGNATFVINGILNGFHHMTVEAGDNTQNIIIDCDSTKEEKEDCKEMTVNAQTAQHLNITVTSANWDTGTIICPSVDTSSSIIPCIVTVGSSGLLRNVEITANDGIPANVWIEDKGGTIDYATITINCDNGQSVGPFSTSSTCWNTHAPTTYLSNTLIPTLHPSQIASQPTTTTQTTTKGSTTTTVAAPTTSTTDTSTTIATPTTSTVAAPTTSTTAASTTSTAAAPTTSTVSIPTISTFRNPIVSSTIDNALAPTTNTIYSQKHAADEMSLALIAIIALCSLILCCCCCIILFLISQHYRKLKSEIAIIAEDEDDSEGSDSQITIATDAAAQQAVLKWLRAISCEQYYHKFIKTGFETMECIQSINNTDILKEIGVKKLGHRAFILTEIQKLGTNYVRTNAVMETHDINDPPGSGLSHNPQLARGKSLLVEVEGEIETLGFVQ